VDKLIPDTDGRGNCHHCSRRAGGRGGHGFLWFLLVGVLAGCFAGWWRFLATDAQKMAAADLAEGGASFLGSLVEWGKEKLGMRRYHGVDHEELNYFQPLGDAGDTQPPGRFTL
jgi:hypothetical protein